MNHKITIFYSNSYFLYNKKRSCIIEQDKKFFIVKKSIEKICSPKEIVENQYSTKIIFHCEEISSQDAFDISNLYKNSELFMMNCAGVNFFQNNSSVLLKKLLQNKEDIKIHLLYSIFPNFLESIKNINDFDKIMKDKNLEQSQQSKRMIKL